MGRSSLVPGGGGRLVLEAGADRDGLREWLERHAAAIDPATQVICFDTRIGAPFGLSGSAALVREPALY